jgi:DNA-binding GntR family transcriptional regulator
VESSSYAFDNPLFGRQSSPELIAESLRQAIIEGGLAPGQSLRQENLARHFDVSRIPVREALRRLESEGWVVLRRNHGAVVTSLSAEEAREIYEIRASLETTALRLAAPLHTPQSLNLAAAFLVASHTDTEPTMYVKRNREFHLALYAPCARPRLLGMIDSLHSQGERYLRLKLVMPAHKRQSDDEHERILAALRKGQVESAVQILEPHLLQTGELLATRLAVHLAADAAAKRRVGKLKRAGSAA